MKIIVANGINLVEKIINSRNKKVTFEFSEYLDFLSFDYDNQKVIFNKNDIYYDVLYCDSDLIEYSKIILKSKIDNVIYKVYIVPEYDNNFIEYELYTSNIIIGGNNLNLSNILINGLHESFDKIIININDNEIVLENNGSNECYVNNHIVNSICNIKYGDSIFIEGVFFSLIGKQLYVFYSNNKISYDKDLYKTRERKILDIEFYKNINYINYNKSNNLNLSPVIKKKIVNKSFSIDPPSSVELKEGNPLILTMMPMVMMSSTSMIMSFNIINNIRSGKSTWEDNKISLIFSGIMIFTMIIYPIIQNAYKKHKESKREIKRIEDYKDYIYEKKREIVAAIDEQKNILLENFKDTKSCYDIFTQSMELIWDKKNGDSDFLTISLGTGKIVPDISVNFPEEHFTIDRDKLRIQVTKLKEQVKYIDNCPITLNIANSNNIAFEARKDVLYSYIKSMLIRLFCSHSYDDIRLCVITNSKNKHFWEQYSNLPYFWNDDYSLRYFGYDTSSISNIVTVLDNIYKERKIKIENHDQIDKDDINYIIIVDNIKAVNNIVFLNELIASEVNYGFTVLFMTEYISSLPSFSKNFVKIKKDEGTLIIKDNNYKEVNFVPDIYDIDFTDVYEKLSALYSNNSDKRKALPSKITFLDMYKVNSLENLNVANKWINNTTLDNIAVPIGINEMGELINLDLHENAHGPHGLIAGMTGSGKSELLISLIMSLSINYSPDDVQFVLIDYKGGGLSNTFYNNTLGKRLPHIVGVITNISESEINRCLISLQSEVKRRQVLFSEASLKYNEGNIDIYKYQQLAKKHKDLEYLSHLIIISDEFAELKTQNPEFIEKLVSLARIGRSLGIHLILCTQKPSGVVDSQIWSNSKFKICLKVQDKSDSKEVIGVDDGVYLNVPGRFYLQIGYNEMFMKGQAAYSSAPYYIESKDSNLIDMKLDFVNEYGKVYYTYNSYQEDQTVISGTHVSNVVKHLIDTAVNMNYKFKHLWKDSLEENILIDELLVKYNYNKNLVPEIVFGEFDEVDNQRKDLAKCNLLDGNIILYGVTGSGKSELIQTSLYFLTKYYLSSEINIYIMDFSLENLKMFSNAPQVGDIMYLYEKEKVTNLFKYVNTILSKRRDILANYGGSIEKYNLDNEEKLPIIYIVISNLERLFENYNDLENLFMDITRDCNKFGITFMVTVSTITGVRNKLIQGFKQVISLELKDKYDYDSIFGSKVKYTIPHLLGRGFIKKGKVYEMQTAKIMEDEEDIYKYIEDLSNSLTEKNMVKALPIPVLPNIVDFEFIKPYLNNNLLIPIGVDVDNLEILKFDFSKKNGVILTGRDVELLDNYTKCFIRNINSINNTKTFIFTIDEISMDNVTIIRNNFSNYFSQLIDFIDKSDINIQYYIVFKSLDDILTKLNEDLKSKALLYQLFDKLNDFDNFHILLVDILTSIKKYEYNEFYINNFNNNRGIFIGEGITEQYVIKTSTVPRKYRELPGENYGYFIENNKVRCMKVMEYKDE